MCLFRCYDTKWKVLKLYKSQWAWIKEHHNLKFTLQAIAGKELSLFETTLLVSTGGNRTDLLSSSCDIQQITAEIFAWGKIFNWCDDWYS